MNRMSALLDKVERRLGVEELNLPERMAKPVWATKVIANDTLDTFSRYHPHRILYMLTNENKKNGWYIIDEDICESLEVIGAGDINWAEFSTKSPSYQVGGIANYDMIANSYDVEDILMTQMMADHSSVFSSGIYVYWEPPNKVKLTCAISTTHLDFLSVIPINLLVKHPTNLMTIQPTKMETFEKLAQADVATFLYNKLKHYDGVDTVFANTDLKIDDLREEANKREDIVQKLEDTYVSAANTNQPVMYTIN